MKIVDGANGEQVPQVARPVGWEFYLHSLLMAYLLFAAVCHTFFPYLTPEEVGLNIHSPSKIIFHYAIGYLFTLLAVHVLIAVPVVAIAKAVPKWRGTAIPVLLYRTLLPAWLIAAANLYVSDYVMATLR